VIITLIFEKYANYFCRKLAKITEHCDHNIDPWYNNITPSEFETPTPVLYNRLECFLSRRKCFSFQNALGHSRRNNFLLHWRCNSRS
jgi:hypothetical protein